MVTKQQERLDVVLTRLAELAKDDAEFADMFSQDMEGWLNVVAGQDGFGTEQQSDPRGDFRENEYSMWNVQGVDD